MLAALGFLRETKADRAMMQRTLYKVLDGWWWPKTRGWDYGMMAVAAARLGEPETAVKVLLMDTPKNTWLVNGHTDQRRDLPLYLPPNGALLAGGWDGGPKENAPGAPKSWDPRAEGLQSLL